MLNMLQGTLAERRAGQWWVKNLQTYCSQHYVIAKAHNFGVCQKCIDDSPECANPARPRMSIGSYLAK
jgi:hypothetical protein